MFIEQEDNSHENLSEEPHAAFTNASDEVLDDNWSDDSDSDAND